MSWLSDEAISRLKEAGALPDVSGTRYRLIERIGSGGMGVVCLAEDSVLERRVALKILDLSDMMDGAGAFSERLLREAKILARLEHPGIVPVHDAGTLADGRVFYAMKFVEGKRLDQLVERLAGEPAGSDSLSDRLRIFQRICDAVGFAHARGVLHRDLKPENIMTGPFGEVLVMDWGIAKILGPASARGTLPAEQSAMEGQEAESKTTAHGTVLGTRGYMSPEQERGEVEKLDARADIFSLGAILTFLLGGEQRAPRPVAAIARKAMAADPSDRYGSVSDLTLDVARYVDGLPVSAYPESILRKAARWASRYRVAIVLVLTYLVVRGLLILFLRR
jgi:eukaryotic-like serine/threonine-protein kinase